MKRFAIFDLSIDCNKKNIFHDFYVESNLTLQSYLIWWINGEIYYFITCCLFFPMLWKIQCDNYFFLVIWICVLTFVNLCLNWFLTWTFLYNLFRKGWLGGEGENGMSNCYIIDVFPLLPYLIVLFHLYAVIYYQKLLELCFHTSQIF